MALDDLPPWKDEHVKTLPVCWKNPVTGHLHFQVHPSAIHELVRRSSFPAGPRCAAADLRNWRSPPRRLRSSSTLFRPAPPALPTPSTPTAHTSPTSKRSVSSCTACSGPGSPPNSSTSSTGSQSSWRCSTTAGRCTRSRARLPRTRSALVRPFVPPTRPLSSDALAADPGLSLPSSLSRSLAMQPGGERTRCRSDRGGRAPLRLSAPLLS